MLKSHAARRDASTRDKSGKKVRNVYPTEVAQHKAISESKNVLKNIQTDVRKGIRGLEQNEFVSEKGDLRVVVNPRRVLKVLYVVFHEGALPEVTAEARELLIRLSEEAGHSGIEIRWDRISGGVEKRMNIP